MTLIGVEVVESVPMDIPRCIYLHSADGSWREKDSKHQLDQIVGYIDEDLK